LRRKAGRSTGNVFVRGDERYLPLYEAKMLHHFDHRYGTYEGQTQAQANVGTLPRLNDAQHDDPHYTILPRYWVPEPGVSARLTNRWDRHWLLGFRNVCRGTDVRTVIAAVLPVWLSVIARRWYLSTLTSRRSL
jgi:hypothetical protein